MNVVIESSEPNGGVMKLFGYEFIVRKAEYKGVPCNPNPPPCPAKRECLPRTRAMSDLIQQAKAK